MAFVTSTIYKKAIQLALKEGIPEKLLDTHLNKESIGDHVPMEMLLEVYELAEKELMPGFGLRQGKQLVSIDYGILGLSWKTCLKAIDVLRNVRRYMLLVTNDGFIEIKEDLVNTKLVMNRDVYRNGIQTANEASFVMLGLPFSIRQISVDVPPASSVITFLKPAIPATTEPPSAPAAGPDKAVIIGLSMTCRALKTPPADCITRSGHCPRSGLISSIIFFR